MSMAWHGRPSRPKRSDAQLEPMEKLIRAKHAEKVTISGREYPFTTPKSSMRHLSKAAYYGMRGIWDMA